MTRTLHLIKHGKPRIISGVPAHEWQLADDALDGLSALISALRPRPGIIISSEEPKARATAQALAEALGVPLRSMLGLHEQLRYTAPWHADPADFQADIARFFAHPQQVVSGEESADDARTRFGNAVNAAMLANPQDAVAIVSHGTVISLLVAQVADVDVDNVDVVELWSALKFLDAVTLSWPERRLREPLPRLARKGG